MSSVLLVVVIVGGVLGACAVALVVALLLVRRAAHASSARLQQAHPDAEIGPEPCQYRGGTGAFPRTRNTGWVVLTPTTLVVHPIVGTEVVLPVADITGTRVEQSFNTYRNGKPVLVLETARGEVGLTVMDLERWQAVLVR